MNKKIVVIDDDLVTLETLKNRLTKEGFQVFSARDGKSGYDLVRSQKPDIVISDLLMPKMHGLELCQKIKEDPRLKKTRVLLMTATYKTAAFRHEIDDSGADEFMEKPVDTLELMKRIYKLYAEIAEEEEKPPSS